MSRYVDIRFVFDEEEPEEDGYVAIKLVRALRLNSDLSEDHNIGIAETLTQSDFGWINLPNGVISVLGGETEVEFRDLG